MCSTKLSRGCLKVLVLFFSLSIIPCPLCSLLETVYSILYSYTSQQDTYCIHPKFANSVKFSQRANLLRGEEKRKQVSCGCDQSGFRQNLPAPPRVLPSSLRHYQQFPAILHRFNFPRQNCLILIDL
jgi:hypothetical protein